MNDLKSIALIGLRGSGKTSLGKLLVRKLNDKALNFAFFDTDEIFTLQEKQSIATYVAQNGWDAFRCKEEQILLELPKEKAIISCGGGIILREKNRLFLKENIFTVFLDVPVDVLVIRLEKNMNTAQRPAFTEKSLAEEMQEVSLARREFYLDTCAYQLTQYTDINEEVRIILEQYQLRK